MSDKPSTSVGYSAEFVDLVRATCLYVATKLGDLVDDIVVPDILVTSFTRSHVTASCQRKRSVAGTALFEPANAKACYPLLERHARWSADLDVVPCGVVGDIGLGHGRAIGNVKDDLGRLADGTGYVENAPVAMASGPSQIGLVVIDKADERFGQGHLIRMHLSSFHGQWAHSS